ncbi:hypothetical protein ACIPY5_19765 [Microbacterium sp. NPDC089698]|uniref:hypothetical protein n=1 Tax=Microbacterium sp. NPDC089698 TaxID=3364200 RepID=UPI0037F42ECE
MTTRPDGRRWTFEITDPHAPDMASITGSTATFTGVANAARALAAEQLAVKPTTLAATVTVDVPDGVRELMAASDAAHAEAAAATARGVELRRRAAQILTDAGYTKTAAAEALGVSAQRIGQLTN